MHLQKKKKLQIYILYTVATHNLFDSIGIWIEFHFLYLVLVFFFVIQCHFLVIRIHNCLFLQSHFIWLIQTWMADRGLTTFGTDIGPAPPRFSACRVDRFQFPQSIVHRTRGPPGYVFFCSTEPEAHRLRQVKA